MVKNQSLKLTIELVPSSSFYDNLRKLMKRSDWDKLRKRIYAEYDNKCGVCGTDSNRLNCHEIWEYDDQNHEQKLLGFIALCPLCHHIKHIGLAKILASQGKLHYESVVEHFMKVNECDRKAFEEYKKQAFAQWRERSRHQWKVDLKEYKHIVESKHGE